MTATPDQILDPEALAGLRDLPDRPNDDVSVHFVVLFLDEARTLVESMRQAAGAGDAEAVSQAAHALRGAAGFVGATRLVAATGALERAADGHGTAALGTLVTAVAVELAALRPVVLEAIGREDVPAD